MRWRAEHMWQNHTTNPQKLTEQRQTVTVNRRNMCAYILWARRNGAQDILLESNIALMSNNPKHLHMRCRKSWSRYLKPLRYVLLICGSADTMRTNVLNPKYSNTMKSRAHGPIAPNRVSLRSWIPRRSRYSAYMSVTRVASCSMARGSATRMSFSIRRSYKDNISQLSGGLPAASKKAYTWAVDANARDGIVNGMEQKEG